jgi:lycopene cyclase domain-containing protein
VGRVGSYTVGAVLAATLALSVDWWVARSRLVGQRGFWAAYAIIVVFQLAVNGVLTAPPVVVYNPDVIIGWRLWYAPVEDLLFGFSLILLTLAGWTRLIYGQVGSATRAPTRARQC